MSRRYNRHHRKPKSKQGKRYVNGHNNIRRVPVVMHRAWHTLFGNLSAQEICAIINDIWLDPDFKFECKQRERGNTKRVKKNNNVPRRSDCDNTRGE